MSSEPGYMREARYVREQYASEKNLESRASLYAEITGPFAGDVAFDILAGRRPRRLLDAGCGPGWFGARVQRELGVEVVAIDQSQRMVEVARREGIDARVADVQALPFGDGEFDCVAAHWMLYHLPDLQLGLSEIARVLAPGGTLVAITNGRDHLFEMWDAVGASELRAFRDLAFSAENGADALRAHFADVEMHDAGGTVTIDSREAIARYLASTAAWSHLAVPDDIPLPLVARRSNVVFVATR